jgi:hypothetical protein
VYFDADVSEEAGPHGPVCSISSQPAAGAAVPRRDSLMLREITAQPEPRRPERLAEAAMLVVTRRSRRRSDYGR